MWRVEHVHAAVVDHRAPAWGGRLHAQAEEAQCRFGEDRPSHELQVLIDGVYEKYLPHTIGEVATYIPELTKADPEAFGVCLVTADGRTFEAGDCDRPFTIQSISKPFTYGMALEEFGPARVFEHVGVEPSGDAFNSIELQNGSNRPFNPMINSGAITVTALLHSRYGNGTFEYLLDRFSVIAGRQLSLDHGVYNSERRTGHRNRAIAHLLLNFGLVHEAAEAALDVYFKQCSILVTCRDLAVMAATLSNMVVRSGAAAPDISSVESFRRLLLAAKSIGYSDSASGMYLSTTLFAKLGVADQVAGKSRKVPGPPSGEPVAAVVARGEVEIGFQQVSELLHVPGVTFVGAIPAELQPGFSFVGAITSAARQPDAARALLRFLASPEAAATILKAGLTLPTER